MKNNNKNNTYKKFSRNNLENALLEFKNIIYSKLDSKEKEILNNLHKKLIENVVNFVVIGQFKRGKSTFINTLLGEKILPTGVIPLTSIITIVKFSEAFIAKVFFNNNTSNEIKISELSSYIAEKENPKNVKNVKYILIGHPSEILKKGMVFVDTPGVGSLHIDNTKVTNEYISKIDAAIFITSTDPALSEVEISFLESVLNITDKVFIVINKIDYLNENEIEEFSKYTDAQLSSRFKNKPVKIFYVSAKDALNAKLNKDYSKFLKSGFADLEKNIINYFENEKENILFDSIKRQLIELINGVEISLELEIKSLLLPLDNLKQKTILLNDSLNSIQKDETEFIKKIKNENKIILDNVHNRIYELKSNVIKEIENELNEFAKINKSIKFSEFKNKSEQLFKELIRNKIENIRIIIEKEIKQKSSYLYQEILDKFNNKINEIYRITSEIFDFKLKEMHIEVEYDFPLQFEYITYDFKLMFNFDKSLFSFFLPSEKRNNIFLDKLLNRTEFTVNYNLGYITDSIERKLEKNLINYNNNLKEKINELINKIIFILNNVKKLKEREKLKYDSIIQTLTSKIQKINALKKDLLNNT